MTSETKLQSKSGLVYKEETAPVTDEMFEWARDIINRGVHEQTVFISTQPYRNNWEKYYKLYNAPLEKGSKIEWKEK